MTQAQRLHMALIRLHRRVVQRDLAAVLAASMALLGLLFLVALLRPDWAAGRAWIFGLLALGLVVAPWVVAFRSGYGGLAGTVDRMATIVSAQFLAAMQLAIGRRIAGSAAAEELAAEQVTLPARGEALQRVPLPWRRGAWLALLSLATVIAVVAPSRFELLMEGLGTSKVVADAQRGMARVTGLRITLEYPDYLERQDQVLEGSDGELEVPAGTRVGLAVQPLWTTKPEGAALLVDGLRVVMELAEDGGLSGSFLARKSGVYRLAVTFDGEEVVERDGHRMTVTPDVAPTVRRLFPEEDVELDGPAVVEWLAEASDDHGLASAQIIYRIEGQGDEQRLDLSQETSLARPQGELDLEALGLGPGDTISWVLEVSDNNNVTGPGVGRSAWHRIRIFDAGRRFDELLEELDRFVGTLGDRLAPLLLRAEEAKPWTAATQKALGEGRALADKLKDPRLEAEAIRQTVVAVVKRLGRAAARYGKGHLPASSMEDRLERDLLYLDDLLSKRRLEQLSRLQRELAGEREALRKLVERSRSSDDPGLKEEILAAVRSIRRRIEELGKKMSKLERRVGQEYVNRDAMKSKNVGSALDRLEAMVRAGQMDEALRTLDEMAQALDQVNKSVNKAAEKFGGKEWREAFEKGRAVQEKMQQIVQRQTRLRGEVQKQRRAAQKRHMKAMGGADKLRKKVQRMIAEARGSLAQMSGLPQWLQRSVRGIDERLARADSALAADGFVEAVNDLNGAQSRLESLGWSLNEPGTNRLAARSAQRKALERVGEAVELLEKMLPDEAELMSAAERKRLAEASGKQAELGQSMGELGEMMKELNGMAPVFNEEALEDLAIARGASGQAQSALSQNDGMAADMSQGVVLEALKSLEKSMAQQGGGGSGGGMPMPWGASSRGGQKSGGQQRGKTRNERVKIPQAKAGAPAGWREEIIEAWGEGFSGPGQPAVERYYRELVR